MTSRARGGDIAAAFALAAVAIPEQLATARLAGVPPALGLIVFVAASLGFFSSWAPIAACPPGADSTASAPIFASALALLAAAGSPALSEARAAALALMVGAMIAAAGLLRLGWIARLLSVPVITGFLAGIAVHIVVSQLPALLGIEKRAQRILRHRCRDRPPDRPIQSLHALAIGLFVFAVITISERWGRHFPVALLAIVLAGAAVAFFPSSGVAVLGKIQPPAFMPALPAIAMSDRRGGPSSPSP